MSTGGRPQLSPRLTAGLDAARALAAIYVVFHHLADAHGWTSGAGVVLRFGQEAVLVFFLLSGFVIFANERTRALRPGGYYLRRLRRIYPGLLVAMALSALVALDNGVLLRQFKWSEFLATLFSVQDELALKPGVIADPFLGNSPLWSLSYEVAFYVAFPLVLRFWAARPRSANHAIGACCCVAYASYVLLPNHWSLIGAYFLVWWCGAMAAEAYLSGGRSLLTMGAAFWWLVAVSVVAAAGIALVGYRGPGVYPFLMFRHFAAAAILLVLLFGPLGAWLASLSARVARPAAALASISYALYVLHYPLLVSWQRARSSPAALIASLLLVAAAFLTDRQLSRWLPRAPAD